MNLKKHVMYVMGSSGHETLVWDTPEQMVKEGEQVVTSVEAERWFNNLAAKGYIPVKVDPATGQGESGMKKFDQDAEEIMMIVPMRGGR